MMFLRWLIPVPFMAMLLLFQIAPAVWVTVNSFFVDEAFGFGHYAEILSSDFFLQSFANSLYISFWSSVIGLLIAVVAAYSLRRVPGRLQRAVMAFSNMVSNFSGVPLAFAFIIILGSNGCITLALGHLGVPLPSLYSRWGVTALYAYFQIPLGILLICPALEALDDDWRDAAMLLGAGPLAYIRRIVIPVLTPACLNTFIMLFANAIGAFATVYALTTGNFNVLTIRIASLVSGDIFLEPNLAAALAVCLVALLTVLVLFSSWLTRRTHA